MTVIALVLFMVVTGCNMDQTPKPVGISKTFFGRTITYTVSPEANELMSRLESLVGQAQKQEPPIPDEIVLPLYRDADIDRDHVITKNEAEVFSKDYIIRFEDSLGQVTFARSR
jgi:hypothetical protein